MQIFILKAIYFTMLVYSLGALGDSLPNPVNSCGIYTSGINSWVHATNGLQIYSEASLYHVPHDTQSKRNDIVGACQKILEQSTCEELANGTVQLVIRKSSKVSCENARSKMALESAKNAGMNPNRY
jgi:hypothetical protein